MGGWVGWVGGWVGVWDVPVLVLSVHLGDETADERERKEGGWVGGWDVPVLVLSVHLGDETADEREEEYVIQLKALGEGRGGFLFLLVSFFFLFI